MTDVADYETDILLWSERQAALLRDLRARVRGLPNELDLENVAEEIESVGRSEQRAAESFVSLILTHLIKVATSTSAEPASHWLSEIRTFRGSFEDAITPSMLQRIDIERLWRRARRNVVEDLRDRGEREPSLPNDCPITLMEIQSAEFSPRDAAERLRRCLTEGGPNDAP